MESQPLNPEFRNNPENFHPRNQDLYSPYLALLNIHTRLIYMINIPKRQHISLTFNGCFLFIHVQLLDLKGIKHDFLSISSCAAQKVVLYLEKS